MNDFIEDPEVREVLARLNERTHLTEAIVDGKRKIVICEGYGDTDLYRIEQFVKAIEKGWQGGFIEQRTRYSGMLKIKEFFLGKHYYQQVNGWIRTYSDIYRYSARVEAFYDVCKDLGLINDCSFCFGKPGDLASADGRRYMDVFNAMINGIRSRCQSREFKEKERLRLINAERRSEQVIAKEEAVFEAKGRWLVLSLTLRFKEEFCKKATLKMIQQYRKRFFAARRYNAVMSGIKWYVWTIEQSEDTGLHLHVILFYSADHNHDEHYADKIGTYWNEEITEGKGEYWNGNRPWLKRLYATRGHGVGVGQIDWSDDEMREALRKNLIYSAKAEQYLMIQGAEGVRTFDMGRVPKRVKVGRPRGLHAQHASENQNNMRVRERIALVSKQNSN